MSSSSHEPLSSRASAGPQRRGFEVEEERILDSHNITSPVRNLILSPSSSIKIIQPAVCVRARERERRAGGKSSTTTSTRNRIHLTLSWGTKLMRGEGKVRRCEKDRIRAMKVPPRSRRKGRDSFVMFPFPSKQKSQKSRICSHYYHAFSILCFSPPPVSLSPVGALTKEKK